MLNEVEIMLGVLYMEMIEEIKALTNEERARTLDEMLSIPFAYASGTTFRMIFPAPGGTLLSN